MNFRFEIYIYILERIEFNFDFTFGLEVKLELSKSWREEWFLNNCPERKLEGRNLIPLMRTVIFNAIRVKKSTRTRHSSRNNSSLLKIHSLKSNQLFQQLCSRRILSPKSPVKLGWQTAARTSPNTSRHQLKPRRLRKGLR